MKQRFTVVPAVYVVFRKDEKILLLRRFNTGYHDGEYSLPAGHLDGGESAVQAAIREVQEEVGVELAATQLKFVHMMHRQSHEPELHERIDIFFEATVWRGTPTNKEPHKHDDLCWVALSDLPENVVPEVKIVLEHIAAGKPYSDHNF